MSTPLPSAFADVLRPPSVQMWQFGDDGTFPNNEPLPTLVFRGAVREGEAGRASTFERLFRAHRWRGHWRNGVFSYHHYHSTAHEVLGVAAGAARLQVGGPSGASIEVDAGDVLVLPAGVAHKNRGAGTDFLVVGAYPEDQEWDLLRGRPGERPEADRNIARVPLPAMDPVYGADGPLGAHWGLGA
jgi:uncharacterized protein YjlB